jgi:hypothetical protein
MQFRIIWPRFRLPGNFGVSEGGKLGTPAGEICRGEEERGEGRVQNPGPGNHASCTLLRALASPYA